ncbi:MAG: fasciclin domain-containing protein [Desulfosarcina sp.]|nr:fasciclin domain-containing protein [Desulfosarcina sp.]
MKKLTFAIVWVIMLALPLSAFAGNYGTSKNTSDAMNTNDIVDTAVAAGSFNTLVAAVQAADLEETLRSKGPFTVFAPTDEAFAKLPPGTLENLLKPENKSQLQAILTYHVVPGKVMAADAATLTSAKTVNGQSFRITESGGGLMVDKATVVKADIPASNGVIHVIDQVILPQ